MIKSKYYQIMLYAFNNGDEEMKEFIRLILHNECMKRGLYKLNLKRYRFDNV